MPMACTVCAHAERGAIDSAVVEGEPKRRIAARFGLAASSLQRHARKHVPEALAKAAIAREASKADALLGRVHELERRAMQILAQAQAADRFSEALAAIREARACLELLGRVAGELQQPSVNLLLSPEWIALRTRLADALRPYPEARAAIAEMLGGEQ